MKKRLTQILELRVLVVLCLSTSALATARCASLYLDDYYVNSAALSGGRVVIEFNVDATKTVSQVDAGCIVLQEYWRPAEIPPQRFSWRTLTIHRPAWRISSIICGQAALFERRTQ